MNNICPQCGAPVSANSTKCEYCGAALAAQRPAQPVQPAQATYNQTVYYQQAPVGNPAINPAWPVKSKIVAGVLALILGGLGIHKFYLGKTGAGILMLIFCWTYIPSIIAFIEGIMILCSNDENFQLKYHCRLQ